MALSWSELPAYERAAPARIPSWHYRPVIDVDVAAPASQVQCVACTITLADMLVNARVTSFVHVRHGESGVLRRGACHDERTYVRLRSVAGARSSAPTAMEVSRFGAADTLVGEELCRGPGAVVDVEAG